AHKETQQARAVFEDLQAASKDDATFRERGLYWRAKSPIAALEEPLRVLQDARKQKETERERLQHTVGAENTRLAELTAEIEKLRAQEGDVALQYAQAYLRSCEFEYRKTQAVEQMLAQDEQTLLAQVADQNKVLDEIKNLQV